MALKHVKFSVYRAVMQIDALNDRRIKALTEKIDHLMSLPKPNWYQRRSLQKHIEQRDKRQANIRIKNSPWDLKVVLDSVINGSINNLVMKAFGESIELDLSTMFHRDSEPHMYAFQLTKLREVDVPSKKKIGKTRQQIDLDDDEYIGEFTEVLYDDRYSIVSIQSNRYGVGLNVVVRFLNKLRKEYLETAGLEYDKALFGELQPVLDPSMVDKALRATMYKRFSVRCSDLNAEAILPEGKDGLCAIKDVIGQKKGIVVDLTINMAETESAELLDTDQIHIATRRFVEYIEDGNISKDDKKYANMELIYYDEKNETQEAVDLLTPRITFYVPVYIEKRKTVGSEELYEVSLKEYKKLDSRLFDLFH